MSQFHIYNPHKNVLSEPVINADQNAGSVTYTRTQSLSFVRVDNKIMPSDIATECAKIDASYSELTLDSDLQYEVSFLLN